MIINFIFWNLRVENLSHNSKCCEAKPLFKTLKMKRITGIYKITNTINNKIYIGSSKDIATRFKNHLKGFKNNSHPNKHLLAAINKYGLNSFCFSILEECQEKVLFQKEQQYIDSYNWKQLYNKSKIAGSGGADTQRIPLYLINLKGEFVKEFQSGLELCEYFQCKVDYSKKNTTRITKKLYRLVTPDFFKYHQDIILSWKSYSNETKQRLLLNPPKFKRKSKKSICLETESQSTI